MSGEYAGEAMLDLLAALLALRLGVMGLVAGAALVLLGAWSLGHGAVGAGMAVLAAVALCVALAGAVARSRLRQR
jgi:hypothetical protein